MGPWTCIPIGTSLPRTSSTACSVQGSVGTLNILPTLLQFDAVLSAVLACTLHDWTILFPFRDKCMVLLTSLAPIGRMLGIILEILYRNTLP